MTKSLKSRLDRLERQCAPQQIICVLDTPENRQLVAEGFLPGGGLPGEQGAAKGACRRLTKSDVVIFLLEAELGV
jgi:hypothetical protein